MLSPSIAQIALRFGANDLERDGGGRRRFYHDAGAKKTSEFTPRNELERLIRAARPRSRGARYALSSGRPIEAAAASSAHATGPRQPDFKRLARPSSEVIPHQS